MPRRDATTRASTLLLILWGAVVQHGYAVQSWLTFRQAVGLGGNVRKGERGTTVVYADRFVPDNERRRGYNEGEAPRGIPFLKRFTVFNVEQCQGLPDGIVVARPPADTSLVLPQVEELIRATGADIRIGGDKAYHDVTGDFIRVPPPQAFFEPINCSRTLTHELGHWSGAGHRLNRDLSGSFGSKIYLQEELCAEICSAYLCAALGIVPTVRHADYLGAWLELCAALHNSRPSKMIRAPSSPPPARRSKRQTGCMPSSPAQPQHHRQRCPVWLVRRQEHRRLEFCQRITVERTPLACFDAAMIPKRPFYFLRHGQTDWNLEERYQGHSDIPLNATGIAQAHAAAECLAPVPIDRIVASPLIRAIATAAIVAEKLQKPIHIDRGLMERNLGSFDGLVIRAVKAQHGLRPDQSSRDILPLDADPFHEILDRIPPVVGKWMTSHPNELLLFVGHGGVFDAIHHHLLGPRAGRESSHAIPYLASPAAHGWELSPLSARDAPHAGDARRTTISSE